jgi:hypothetical protein
MVLGRTSELRVTDYAPGQLFAYESTGWAGRLRHEFALRPDENGCVLISSIEVIEASRLQVVGVAVIAPRLKNELMRVKARIEDRWSVL